MERVIHVLRLAFELLDFANLIVDAIFVILTLYSRNKFQAVVLLIGVILARLSARQGRHKLKTHWKASRLSHIISATP